MCGKSLVDGRGWNAGGLDDRAALTPLDTRPGTQAGTPRLETLSV